MLTKKHNSDGSAVLDAKTEEVQDIIERLPTNFAKIITAIVSIVLVLLVIFGWLIRYPDVVAGEVTINAIHAPVKMVSLRAGKIKLLNTDTNQIVQENQIIAYIESASDFQSAQSIKQLVGKLHLPLTDASSIYHALPKETRLGELSSTYFAFLNAVKQLADYQKNQLYAKQEMALKELLQQEEEVLRASSEKLSIAEKNQQLYNNFYYRDSVLFSKKVLSAGDFDRTKINHIGALDVYQNALREIATGKEQIARTNSQLQEVVIQKTEKEQQLKLDISTQHNALLDQLRAWEQQYLFIAPISGKIQFLKFWNDNQFVATGEEVFTLLPEQQDVLGQVTLPASGAGKVSIGQEVIVKLEDYPYMEYGSIAGKVKNVSLTTKSTHTENGSLQHYLVVISFPKSLRTNYGTELGFRYEIKGTAEIITKNRRLLERFFDNLKYIAQK